MDKRGRFAGVGSFARFISKCLLVLLILWGIAYAVFLGLAVSKENSVEKRWAAAGMPLKGFLEGLPRTEKNAAAKRLEELTAKLGLSILPMEETQPKEGEDWKKANGVLSTMVTAALEEPGEPSGGEVAVPEPLASFFTTHEADLAAIRDLLIVEKVTWDSHPEKGAKAPLPNLVGQLNLTRLLVAHAIALHQEKRDEEALKDLDALWHLGDSLRESPFLIGQYVCIAETNMVVATLRHLEGAPAFLRERLAAYDPDKTLRIPLRSEAYMMFYGVRVWGFSPGIAHPDRPALSDRLLTTAIKPYLRFCAADMAGLFLTEVQRLDALGPCASDAELISISKGITTNLPKWNLLVQVAYPNLGGSSRARPKQLKLQMELTDKVLQLREMKARQGTWPKEAPGIEKSFCPKETWKYEATAEGGMSLTFSGPPISKELVKHPYRLEYKEAGPAAVQPKK